MGRLAARPARARVGLTSQGKLLPSRLGATAARRDPGVGAHLIELTGGSLSLEQFAAVAAGGEQHG